jgi:hypothetical protein
LPDVLTAAAVTDQGSQSIIMPVIVTLYEPLRRCVCGRDCNWVDPFIPEAQTPPEDKTVWV